MIFLGPPLSLLALGFAVAAAAIGALYLIRQQRRRVVVPFVALWTRLLGPRESQPLWRRLRQLLSLLLQLLILALLLLALGDPRPRRPAQARTIALLVDVSASMQATDEAPSRFERARDEARRLALGLGSGDRAVVIAVDAEPRPQGGLSDDPAALGGQLDGLTPSDTGADLAAALRLAGFLLAGQPRPTVVLLGDGGGYQAALDRLPAPASPTEGLDLRYVAVGRRRDNFGITAFAVRRYPQQRSAYEVLVELASFAEGARRVRLELLQEGAVVDVQRFTLPGRGRIHHRAPNLAGAGAHLEARLAVEEGDADPLAVDDRAFALVPPRRRQRVLLVSPGNLFLEGALLLDENAVVERIAPEAYEGALATGYDAVIFDAFTPPAPPERPALYLDPRAPGSPFATAGELAAPVVTDLARHPLTRWLSLADLNLARATVFRLAPGEVAIARALRAPLLVARERPHKTVAVGFDLRRSDLPLRVAFPVLLVNVLEWFAGEEATLVGGARTGQPLRLAAVGPLLAGTAPDGAPLSLPVLDGRATLRPRQAGLYRLGGREWAASLVDGNESDLAPVARLTVAGRPLLPPDPATSPTRRPPWILLLLAALLLLAGEWITYHRRVTT